MSFVLLSFAIAAAPVEPILTPAPLPPPQVAPAARRWPGAAVLMQRLADDAERAALRRDPHALAHLYRLWNFHQLLEIEAPVHAAIARIKDAPVAPLVRDHAAYLAAALLARRGREEDARRQIAELGIVTRLSLIGPFDNAAGRRHDEALPPEHGEGFTMIRGKAGPVSWREVPDLTASGIHELGHLVHPASEATVYAAVVVEVKRKSDVVLRVGSTDQLAIFLDGARVYAEDARREARLDQRSVPMSLAPGKHLVLLKLSWLESVGQLVFRFTRPQGGAADLVVDGRLASVRAAFADPAMRPALVTTPSFAFARPEDGFDRLPAEPLARAKALALRADLYAVLSLYDQRTLPSPPEQDLAEAIRLDPSDPLWRFFYAHRVEARDPNLSQEQLLAALIADPGHAPSLLKRGDLARAGGRVLEARQLYEEAAAADASFMPAHLQRATLGFDELSEGAVAIARLSGVAGVGDSPSALLERARMRRSVEDIAGARADAARVLELDATRHLARHLALDLAVDAGETAAALELASATRRARPYYAPLWVREARLLAGAGRLPAGVALLVEAAAIFPNDPLIHATAAELELWRGDRDAAIAALDRSLVLDPHQPELRRHRRHLSGERGELKDRHSLDVGPLVAIPVTPEEQQYGAVILAERNVVRLYGDGKSTRFRQLVLRMQNAHLKEGLRVHRIDFSPSREEVEVLTAERIRADGEVLRATRIQDDGPEGKVGGMYLDQRSRIIIFDDLAPGDVVHLRWRVDSTGDDLFGGFFGDIEAVQGVLPKRDVVYELRAPSRLPLYWSGRRVPAPAKTVEAEETRLSWSFPTVAALEVEPNSPPYPEIGALISVSTYERWDALGAWYAKLYSEQLALDDAGREAAQRAVAGVTSSEEKIRRIYDYVVKNTRYVGIELGIHGWKPFPAAETHRRRYGDCKDKSTLLIALLREVGVDASLVLVRTADRGTLPADHATMWAFNHAITHVPSANLYLDPTAEFSGSTELPHLDQGAMALIVHSSGKDTRLVRLPESQASDNLNQSQYVARLGENTELELEGVERFFGARAAELRQEFEEVEQRQNLIERQLGQLFEGARVTSTSFSDLSDLEQPVEYGYAARVPRYGRLEGDRLIIPVALFQHQVASVYAQLAKRHHDVYLANGWATQNVIRYELPPGAELESLPEGLEIDTPHVSLKQVVKRTPTGFLTDDTVTIKSRIIPVADYAAFREAALAVDRALARKVVIRW